MNSETWLVRAQKASFVAKRVAPGDLADFVTGCELAWTLADAGLVTGPPVPASDGRLVVAEQRLALLEVVPGRELTGETDGEQWWIAGTLAAVHRAGGAVIGPSTATFATDWLSPSLAGVDAPLWLGPVIEAVRAETDPLTVTWSVVHGDPSPEAFVHDDDTGLTGLIDWSGAKRGPVLYDVASAVMYLGGPDGASPFLDAYLAHGPLPAEELAMLDAFRRFRWAVQAAYFAWRVATDNLTGIADHAANQKGLDDARRGLAGLGL